MVLQYLGLNPISDDPAHPAEECAPQSDTFHRQSYITAIRTVDFRSDRYIIAPDCGPHIRLQPVFFSDRRFGPSANVGDTCIYSMGIRWFVPADAGPDGCRINIHTVFDKPQPPSPVTDSDRTAVPNHAPHERQLSGTKNRHYANSRIGLTRSLRHTDLIVFPYRTRSEGSPGIDAFAIFVQRLDARHRDRYNSEAILRNLRLPAASCRRRLGRKDSLDRRLGRPVGWTTPAPSPFYFPPCRDRRRRIDVASSSVPANMRWSSSRFTVFSFRRDVCPTLPAAVLCRNREDKSDRKPSSGGAYNRGSSSFAIKIYKSHPGILHI